MIPVDSLLYKIDQKLNKLSSSDHQNIWLEDKILALNEAQLRLIKQKMGQKDHKQYEDLQILMENYHPLSLTGEGIIYSASLSTLTPSYMFYQDAYILADKGECKGKRIRINKDLASHADVQTLLNNEHYRPSFEYEETFNTISSDTLSVYTDGTFTPTKLYISYVRYPLYIDKEGYTTLEGEPSSTQGCELPLYMEDELVDAAVQILAMYTENISAVQSAQMRMQNNE